MNSARSSLLLVSPYVVPDEPLIVALCCAALRGVRVRVLVPERSDRRTADLAGRASWETLLQAGVQIFEHGEGVLHVKAVVVDEEGVLLGTANLDRRSFFLNYELMLFMPDARIAPGGTWRSGLSFMRPYQAIWSSVAVFPWLEGSFRYTRIYGVPGFPDRPGTDYGDFKDKSFDAKLLLLPERGAWPALAFGVQDVGGGTGLFRAPYAVASKRFGELDLTLGYGKDRLDGAFGGVRWSPARLPGWGLVAEYDACDYPNVLGAALSGAAEY